MKPTLEFYNFFQFIYDHFNSTLFEEQLPNCMIVITRKTSTLGYYSPKKWKNEDNMIMDELAINPLYLSQSPLIQILQTMAHEMCHLWQYHYGKPSRHGYHNKEWGKKMESIGLMPSNTGMVGGKKLGQQMMDYPITEGYFIAVCCEMVYHPNFENLWFDITRLKVQAKESKEIDIDKESSIYKNNEEAIHYLYSIFYNTNDDDDFESSNEEEKEDDDSKKKVKYSCDCGNNVWGKPELEIYCKGCKSDFLQSE